MKNLSKRYKICIYQQERTNNDVSWEENSILKRLCQIICISILKIEIEFLEM